MRRKRFERDSGLGPTPVGPPKVRILKALARYRYLTTMQLAFLCCKPTTISWCRQLLKELYHESYVERLEVVVARSEGSAQVVHTLDRRGWDFLKQTGLVAGK